VAARPWAAGRVFARSLAYFIPVVCDDLLANHLKFQ
jgi:hypothetical protein